VSSLSTQDLRREQFEALMGRVYEPLQRYAGRRTDPETAQDVVAEVLVVLWRRMDEAPADALVPWCYGVARRVLANTRRGDARRLRLLDWLTHHAPVELDPGEGAARDLALHDALRQLRPDDREVLYLWAWEGLEPREIAVVLDLSANAASIRLHRAKRRLGQIAGKEGAVSGQTSAEDGKET
jgi:RNA polymerase sigma-70 factor (ECF subfamily)